MIINSEEALLRRPNIKKLFDVIKLNKEKQFRHKDVADAVLELNSKDVMAIWLFSGDPHNEFLDYIFHNPLSQTTQVETFKDGLMINPLYESPPMSFLEYCYNRDLKEFYNEFSFFFDSSSMLPKEKQVAAVEMLEKMGEFVDHEYFQRCISDTEALEKYKKLKKLNEIKVIIKG